MCTRKISWLYLLTAFILLGASPINAKPIAGSTLNNFESAENGNRSVSLTNSNSLESNAIAQVNSVSQLSDVKTTDWAFQSLQSVVERYGCIVGYPDSTYKGNRALSRYEFAAGLNACLDRINELIATSTADLVSKEDLATLQKLQEEFAAELATIRGRVDALETRTATLEKQHILIVLTKGIEP